jgi:hypothetical protein
MNHSEYTETMHSLIDSVYEEVKRDETQELSDIVHETVDGHQWVIYYAQAWDLVSFVRQFDFSEYVAAQDYLEDIGEGTTDLDTLMTQMAFWIMYNIIHGAVQERLEEEEDSE